MIIIIMTIIIIIMIIIIISITTIIIYTCVHWSEAHILNGSFNIFQLQLHVFLFLLLSGTLRDLEQWDAITLHHVFCFGLMTFLNEQMVCICIHQASY